MLAVMHAFIVRSFFYIYTSIRRVDSSRCIRDTFVNCAMVSNNIWDCMLISVYVKNDFTFHHTLSILVLKASEGRTKPRLVATFVSLNDTSQKTTAHKMVCGCVCVCLEIEIIKELTVYSYCARYFSGSFVYENGTLGL